MANPRVEELPDDVDDKPEAPKVEDASDEDSDDEPEIEETTGEGTSPTPSSHTFLSCFQLTSAGV